MTGTNMIAKADAVLGEMSEGCLLDAEDMLRRFGATDAEKESFLSQYRVQLAQWRATTLAELARRIDGARTGMLH